MTELTVGENLLVDPRYLFPSYVPNVPEEELVIQVLKRQHRLLLFRFRQ